MSGSAFRVNHIPPSLDVIEDNFTANESENTSDLIVDEIDENEELLLIPVNSEISPDFTLIGYDDTIRHIEEVLTQASKRHNILLHGDNGCGKTAIVQGLVQRKNDRNLSIHMYKRMFYRLNTSKLLHNDDVSEINKQFNHAILELGRYDVLVIESFYTFVNYLKTKGANAVVIGLLEALDRKKFQAIVTCGSRESALLLAEIPEIHEFFSPERICEPNDSELLNILRGVQRSYEKRYAVTIPDETNIAIRDFTQKYRNGFEGWAQPGRALIVLDRSIAQFSVQMNSKDSKLLELENEIENSENELQSLEASTMSVNLKRCETLKARLEVIHPEMLELKKIWEKHTAPILVLQQKRSSFEKKLHTYIVTRRKKNDLRSNNELLARQNLDINTVSDDITKLDSMIKIVNSEINKINSELAKINLSDQRDHTVTPENIATTFSEMSGVDLKQLNEDERERIINIENILSDRVYGQIEAVQAVAKAVRRSSAGLTEGDSSPQGSFLFLGPSGVGKTELGKALAVFLTGDEKNLIRIDMSEFMEKHSVSKLIGAPPGYAGYEAGGILTESVYARPKSIVMFDECEKAHEDIFKILLQVLGDGRLTDGKGVTVNFRDTYVVLTSNIGTPHFLNENISYDEAAALAQKDIDKILLPEIRGRIDTTICFRRLSLPMLTRVFKKRIKAISSNLAKRGVSLNIDDSSVEAFCIDAQDSRYGARAILKAMKSSFEDQLSTSLLTKARGLAGTFNIVYADGKFNEFDFIESKND